MDWTCNPPEISDFIHPNEKDATLAIQESNIYNYVAQYCGDIIANAISIPDMVLTGYPVTRDSAPRIYMCYKKALSRLGCKEEYPLYMDFGYELSGKIYGSEENGYCLVINSECGEKLTDDELTAFLGGEIGHLLAGHPQKRVILDNIEVITKRVPFAGDLVKNNILGFFSSWLIASEYTADRAAIFACENIDAVISLRKAQMGLKNFETELILHQEQCESPSHPGMYYMLMAKELPILGAVSRIQEICRWVKSDSFVSNYTSLLYKLCLNCNEIQIPYDPILLERHRKAANGDSDEMVILGEQYMFGKGKLPQNTITGESFFKEAAFCGNAKAMFLEGACMEIGMTSKCKYQREADMLYRAAASRGNLKAQSKVSVIDKKRLPQSVLLAAKEVIKTGPLQYWISISCQPPNKEALLRALNNFWIPINEPVFATEFESTDRGSIGVILTSGGIYGSWQPGEVPFYIDWTEYQALPLVQMELEEQNYLYCGERPFYLCKPLIRGTMADLLIRIKRKMK